MKHLDILDYPTKEDVVNEYPDADVIEAVEGGWAVFFTQTDYLTWKNQI